MTFRVALAVRSDSFAGVERSIVLLARGLSEAGVEVTVIGGAPVRMRMSLGGIVRFVPASSTLAVARALVARVPSTWCTLT